MVIAILLQNYTTPVFLIVKNMFLHSEKKVPGILLFVAIHISQWVKDYSLVGSTLIFSVI